ncbi:MAG: hypothetical protein PHG36_11485 [Dehalococcoidia bacterium]|nr:hypothetical protein [Dehalococcoidia bacterium]
MKKYSLLILIAGFAVLILITQKLIMPLVQDVIKSDLFLVDSKDQGSQLPISTPLTDLAFMHCNNYIKSELGPDVAINFHEKPIKAWSLGNYQYVINAKIDITDELNKIITKKYVCRITYKSGDNEEEGAMDFDNWSIEGLSGLDNIN